MASFGCDDQICDRYHQLNEKPFQTEKSTLQQFAFYYGLSQLIQNCVFGSLYYI